MGLVMAENPGAGRVRGDGSPTPVIQMGTLSGRETLGPLGPF